MMSSGLTGIFPAFSHSQAAARFPRILDKVGSFVEIIARVVYARSASPAPTASIMRSAKLSTLKKAL